MNTYAVSDHTDVTRFIEETPDQEALFVKGFSGDPRTWLLNRLAGLICLVIDCDGTIHPGLQWVLIENTIEKTHPALARHLRSLRRWYENKYTIRPRRFEDWWVDTYDPACREGIQGGWVSQPVMGMVVAGWTDVELHEVAEQIHLREGADSLLGHARFEGSVLINSIGVEDLIRHALQAHVSRNREHVDRDTVHRISQTNIAAARLVFEENDARTGRILGHHLNIVTSAAKRVATHRFLGMRKVRPEQTLVVGDTVLDLDMGPPGALRVFVSDPDHDDLNHTKTLRQIEDIWGHTDVILRSRSLSPLVELIDKAGVE